MRKKVQESRHPNARLSRQPHLHLSLCTVAAAAIKARASDRVHLVEEDDARLLRARQLQSREKQHQPLSRLLQGNRQAQPLATIMPCSSPRQVGGGRPSHLEELADHACALARVLLQGQAAGRQGGACRGQ